MSMYTGVVWPLETTKEEFGTMGRV